MLANGAVVYPNQIGRYHAESCNSSAVNYTLVEPGHTPLYVGLPSMWGSMYGDHKFSPLTGDSERYEWMIKPLALETGISLHRGPVRRP